MDTTSARPSERLPWYAWPLVPFVFVATLVLMLPLGALALLSIPYFLVFPDRHAQIHDFGGTPRQQELLARWRESYSRLGIRGRLARRLKLWRRKRRAGQPRAAADPAARAR